MVTEYLISELAQPLCFHADIFCRGGTSWALVHSIEAVYCNMKLAYKQFYFSCCLIFLPIKTVIYIYIFFFKVLSAVFKASSTILSMSKGPLIIQIVHGRTSYDALLLPLPPILLPRSFQELHEKFLSLVLFHGTQTDSFAFFLLASIIVKLESALNRLCFRTRKSIHYIFCVSHS